MADWDQVELDYRTGFMTNAQICQKYDISSLELDNAIETRHWTQTILKPEDEATVLSLAEQETPRFPIDSIINPDDAKRVALLTIGQVVRLHRADIVKMRGITNEVINRLTNYLIATGDEGLIVSTDEEGKIDYNIDGKAAPKLFLLLGKDSPADLLEKLSRIMTRMIALERQAYGLDTMTIIPDEEVENQTIKDIKNLADKIRMITVEKAQKKEDKKEPAK